MQPSAAGLIDTLVVDVDPHVASVGEARETVGHYLHDAGLAGRAVCDIVLVASELITNAVEQRPGEPIRVVVAGPVEGAVRLTVENRGDGDLFPN